jgi:hypothetical protein
LQFRPRLPRQHTLQIGQQQSGLEILRHRFHGASAEVPSPSRWLTSWSTEARPKI